MSDVIVSASRFGDQVRAMIEATGTDFDRAVNLLPMWLASEFGGEDSANPAQ